MLMYTVLSMFVGTFVLCTVAILSLPWHRKWSADRVDKVQGIHTDVVPRVGGLCVVLSILACLWFSEVFSTSVTLILLSALPTFLFGLAEDLGMPIPPAVRLGSSLLSGVFAVFLLGIWLVRVDVPYFDDWLNIPAIGILLTILASTTLCQAYNLSDGLNGLSSGLFIIAMLSLTFICWSEGNEKIATASIVLAASALGFWFANFFTGRIFLGDGGAYFFGHLIAWFSILVVFTLPTVSPWALLLNTIIPVIDTLMAMMRRFRKRKNVALADKEHLHHVLYAWCAVILPKNFKSHWQNSIASLIILSAGLLGSIAAWQFYHSSSLSALGCLFFSMFVVMAINLVKVKSKVIHEEETR